MAVYFVDASALVKRYRLEDGSERVSQSIERAERLFASRLTQAEVSAAIIRRGRAMGVPVDHLDQTLAALNRDLEAAFDVVELDPPVIWRACDLTRKHALRAADAVQLACAIHAQDMSELEDLILLSSDQELNAAAVAEGFLVENPAQPGQRPA